MTVEAFNGFYFLFIGLIITIYLVLYLNLRHKKPSTQIKTIIIIAFINLYVHFTKIIYNPYRADLPYSLKKLSFENICAVSTLLLPWILKFSKNKTIWNYFFFISFCGGIGALFFPTEALGEFPFTYDVIRFYFCHGVLLMVPMLLASLNLFRPDFKYTLRMPFMFLLISLVILLNELILIGVGLVDNNWADFFDPNIRNSSFIFGPNDDFTAIKPMFDIFTPKVFRKNIFGIEGMKEVYWPLVWMIIPVFIYINIGFLLVCMVFNPYNTINVIRDIPANIKKKINNESDHCNE